MKPAYFRALALLGLLVTSTRGAIIDHSMVIDAEHSFPGEAIEVVDGENPPTVVDIVEGAIIGGAQTHPDIIARGQSRVRLWDDGIIENDSAAVIELHDQSRMSIAGKYAYWQDLGVFLQDSSHLDLLPGSSIWDAYLEGTASARIFNCELGAVQTYGRSRVRMIGAEGLGKRVSVYSHGNSEIKISNSSLENVIAYDDSVMYVNGGGIGLGLTDRATVYYTGGRFIDGIGVGGDATLYVYGYDLKIVQYDDEPFPVVQGYDRNMRPFYSWIQLEYNGRIVLHQLPEPSSVWLGVIGLGGLALARRRRVAG